MGQLKFAAGHVFFRPGDASEQAFLLSSGRVEVLNADGQRIATLSAGDVFGEMALVEERPHAFTVRALDDGAAETLTRAEFEQSLIREPVRCKQYLTRLFERLRLLAARVEEIATPEPAEPTGDFGLTLTPLTPKARQSLRDDGVKLWRLPFRIGRASDANEPEPLDLNDLWLMDERPFLISRNHLSIDAFDRGTFVVRDRGSYLGAVVNGEAIGGKSRRRAAELKPGDNTIIVGPPDSPFQFRLTVRPGAAS